MPHVGQGQGRDGVVWVRFSEAGGRGEGGPARFMCAMRAPRGGRREQRRRGGRGGGGGGRETEGERERDGSLMRGVVLRVVYTIEGGARGGEPNAGKKKFPFATLTVRARYIDHVGPLLCWRRSPAGAAVNDDGKVV